MKRQLFVFSSIKQDVQIFKQVGKGGGDCCGGLRIGIAQRIRGDEMQGYLKGDNTVILLRGTPFGQHNQIRNTSTTQQRLFYIHTSMV